MNLKETIQHYLPFNEQEAQDKAFMLYALDHSHDLLYRSNEVMHFSVSCWIVNPAHTKTLMIYHRIYDSWAWSGGHADGEEDLLKVAVKEMQEETGISHAHLVSAHPFSLEVLTVDGHIKNNRYVSSHLHLNLTYLFEADENEKLIVNDIETNGVQWIKLSEVHEKVSEKWMMTHIYQKLLDKLDGEIQ